MAHINLLPWRENRRTEQKKRYLTLLAGIALLCLSLMFSVGHIIERLSTNQNVRNRFIEQQTSLLTQQIGKIVQIKKDKQALQQKMLLIEQLESSRNVVPIVLDELVKLVPTGLSFKRISRLGNQIEILGVSESNNRLADFMRKIETSTVFSRPTLSSIVADTSTLKAISEFTLTFSIEPRVAPELSIQSEEPSK